MWHTCPFKGTCWKVPLCIIGYPTLIPHGKGDQFLELINFPPFVTSNLPHHIHLRSSQPIPLTAPSQKHSSKGELPTWSVTPQLTLLNFLGSARIRKFIPTSNTTQQSVLELKPNTVHKSCSCQHLALYSTGIRWHCRTGIAAPQGTFPQWRLNQIFQHLCQATHWHILCTSLTMLLTALILQGTMVSPVSSSLVHPSAWHCHCCTTPWGIQQSSCSSTGEGIQTLNHAELSSAPRYQSQTPNIKRTSKGPHNASRPPCIAYTAQCFCCSSTLPNHPRL